MDTAYFALAQPRAAPVESPAAGESANTLFAPRAARVYLLPAVNLRHYAERGLFEAWLIDWSRQLCAPDRAFLDIGAHTGTYAVSLAAACARVLAFEPQRHTFYALCGSVALSGLANVECLQIGLGSADQVGRRALRVCSRDGGGSSLRADLPGVFREEDVEVRTLDSFGLADVGFVKIDAEGNELEILRGARDTLLRCGRPKVLFESNDGLDAALAAYFVADLGYRHIVPIRGAGNMFLAE